MTLNLTGLQQVADRKRSGKVAWQPPSIEEWSHLGEHAILAFDQSLAATGFVHLSVSALGGLFVADAVTFRTTATEGKGGHEENLDRALIQYRSFKSLLSDYRSRGGYTVVHEMVPVGGGKLNRPESSLLAAHSLRTAVAELELELAPSVAVREHRKAVCGNPSADKREAHAVLAQLAEELDILNYKSITNDNTRDALCVALACLRRAARG